MPHTTTIAIFAGTKATTAYLAEIVRLAGFTPVMGTTGGAALVLTASGGAFPPETDLPVLRLGGEAQSEAVRVIDAPAKAAHLIGHLQKAMQSQKGMPAQLQIGDFTLDTRDNLWKKGENAAIRLTEKETAILAYLHMAGNAVPREDLLHHVWSYVPDVETHTLETHIYRLRQKIEDDPSNPKILLTQGDGYSIAVTERD